MPHINRVRLVNVNYNDAKSLYDDFMMEFNGKAATYDLVNGGGKSVLLLMLLQNVIPNVYLKSDRPIKNIFLGGEGLFLTKLVGPGKVIIQSQNFTDFAGRIASMIPTGR